MSESIVFFVIAFFLVAIASSPSYLLLKFISNVLPARYKFKHKLFSIASVVTALILGVILNIELEAGLMSALVYMVVVPIVCGLALVIGWALFKVVYYNAKNT